MKLKPFSMFLNLVPAIAMVSSHCEAPFIGTMPQTDGTDTATSGSEIVHTLMFSKSFDGVIFRESFSRS